ncbi:ribose-phosphate diphosphokinase [Natranaerobius thermophilus]|uniref:Ribose-phosphate pyrophosphokinase n=1 Tax=Natranaerobius thermophilus (strain ATCC BAA-1301 / DSM 18059 / JW/NM-WN-LF) TaxID=457570 RepID=B2A3N4_NATTJ|nr:ribose-phosphate diphosphokinase [Natranaerobius thermophilus]ACB83660.1 ribose-phosphate pyrophosphokinase [Natranaerobius thermophilus JW/NM-WN-LF]
MANDEKRLNTKNLKIFSGNANLNLSQEITEYLGVDMGKGKATRFSDGEIDVVIEESIRGSDVFVVQPICSPANENIMELLIMLDAFKRASAQEINVVIPYYGYARKDRKARARDPITAKLMADLLETAGANRVITMDLHAQQIQGFFNIPLDHLQAGPILADYFQEKGLDEPVIVSPDMGGVPRARAMAENLNCPIAIIDKRRPDANVAEIMNVVGDVEGKTAIMIDDLIDTAGTMSLAAEALLKHGAKDVYACCTHPVLSGPAVDRLSKSPIKEIVVTNTIPLPKEKELDKIKVLSVAPLIGEAILRVHNRMSVSTLFEDD